MGSKASTCIGKGNPPTSVSEVENVGWKTMNWWEINLESFSELVFSSTEEANMIWRNMRYPGWEPAGSQTKFSAPKEP